MRNPLLLSTTAILLALPIAAKADFSGPLVQTFGTIQQLPAGITSTPTVTSGGAATNVVGDVLTLNDGCTGTVNGIVQAHAKLNVATVTGGPPGTVATVTINTAGVCATPPTNPVTVLSSTGSDVTSTYTVGNAAWGGSFTPTRSPVLVMEIGGGGGAGGTSAVNGAAAAPGSAASFVSYLWYPVVGTPVAYHLGIPGAGGANNAANSGGSGTATAFSAGPNASGGFGGAGSISGAAAATGANTLRTSIPAVAPTSSIIIQNMWNVQVALTGIATNGIAGMQSPWGAGGTAGASANGGNATGYGAGGGAGAWVTAGPANGVAGGNGSGGALAIAQ